MSLRTISSRDNELVQRVRRLHLLDGRTQAVQIQIIQGDTGRAQRQPCARHWRLGQTKPLF